jgi:HAD superfamily hydrolase (TIGR01549 family)
MKKIIIFDLDGTLINSDPITINAINKIRKEDNLPTLKRSAIIPFLARGGYELVQNTISSSKSTFENEGYLKRLRQEIAKYKIEENILFPNVRAMLNILKKRNITLCICTNKASSLVKKILFDLKIHAYFKNIVADGDLDTRKPSKNNFTACMQGIKFINSECLIIGDSEVDLKFAKNVGVDFLAYNNKTNIEFIWNYGGAFFEDYTQLSESKLIFSS